MYVHTVCVSSWETNKKASPRLLNRRIAFVLNWKMNSLLYIYRIFWCPYRTVTAARFYTLLGIGLQKFVPSSTALLLFARWVLNVKLSSPTKSFFSNYNLCNGYVSNKINSFLPTFITPTMKWLNTKVANCWQDRPWSVVVDGISGHVDCADNWRRGSGGAHQGGYHLLHSTQMTCI